VILKPLILVFSWALVLELFTFAYYLWKGTRPPEFYVNLFLLIFTVACLIVFVTLEKKRRDKDGPRG